jgi:hypothetical protein
LGLFILLRLGVAIEASGGGRPSFAEFVRQSETILSGTIERAWVEMDRRVHEPVVRVTLKGIRAVKGSGMDRPLVTFWLPEADSGLTREGVSREFRKGERYIFLISESLDEERTGYVPIMALNGGLFPVLYDSSRRRPLVHDIERRPVARIGRDCLVVIDATPSASRSAPRKARRSDGAISMGPRIEVLPLAEDPGTRVSEEEFLRAVREILTGRTSGSRAPNDRDSWKILGSMPRIP